MPRPLMGYFAGAAFALTAAASAATAFAQVAPPAPGALGDHQRGERIERRIIMHDGEGHHMDQAEHLRTMLQLKPSQEAALTAYLAAVKPAHHHETIVEMSNHGEGTPADAPKTTPQRLAEMEARLAEQTAQGHARIEATKKFYDQLEPSQKKVFDELPMLMIGPMGPMMNMGNMRVLVNMDGAGNARFMEHMAPMPPLPPLPPLPPAPPRAVSPPAPRS